MAKLFGFMENIESRFENKMIPIKEIQQVAREKNIPAEKIDEYIEKLKRSGDIFEPKPGYISKL